MAKRIAHKLLVHKIRHVAIQTACGRSPEGLSLAGFYYDNVKKVTCKTCIRVIKSKGQR